MVGQQCGPRCCPSAAPAGSQKTPCRLPAHHRSFIYSFPSGSTFSLVATFYCNIVLDGKIINTLDTTLSFGRPPKGVEWPCWCGSSVVFTSKSGVFLMPPLPLTAGKGQVDATGNLLMPQHTSVGPSCFQRTAVFTHMANTLKFQSQLQQVEQTRTRLTAFKTGNYSTTVSMFGNANATLKNGPGSLKLVTTNV